MYDGYNFCGVDIYNPWSILNYAADKVLDNYWTNTSGNGLIIDMIKKTNDDVKVIIEKLLVGEAVDFSYNPSITYLDCKNNNSEEDIINLLFISGYLTLDESYDVHDKKNMLVKNTK